MTAPIWMASPPEVHSALLSSGPGPGSLLAAAAAWYSLSAEYASVAEELNAVVAGVQADVWEGPSAESYVAANLPYLAWLTQASANSAAAATQLETAAAAYTAALAAMPTLAELAANHATHAVLVATNFFGINTIPIALNEADYARMWVQAATAMTTYQAVSGTAVASTPQTTPAPQIVKTEKAPAAAASDGTGLLSQFLSPQLQQQLPTLMNHIFGDLDPSQLPPVTSLNAWTQNVIDNFGEFPQFLSSGLSESHDFDQELGSVVFTCLFFVVDRIRDILELVHPFLPLLSPALLAPAVAPAGASGLAGLAGLTGLTAPAVPVPTAAPIPVGTGFQPLSVLGNAPAVVTVAAPPPPAPAPAPAAAGAPPAPPPAAGGAGFVPPYAVGPPGIRFGSGVPTGVSSSAKRKALEPDIAATAAAAATREQRQARRRRRAIVRDHGDEYADMNIDVDPDWREPLASGNGAGPLGFAGTVRNEAAEAAGLATLAGDEFGGGPTVPMVPGGWEPDVDQ
ncbi:PPE family protein [Candidatus Mycobacterium methanotrophicum]|uniref:PPE family protein n=1 Tax=Candidatus Mycobacterium methanotrophicum TaxID=2943498 RepID=A0ABY4QHR1_9MYCO|nr:PPE family protein [Candidatus Mycobacterium methanotrophicum]UQX10557.1 PPE family protein [Candidatus Mycobacterium methanotrophicum]